ncbi:hypothetical protein Pst134EB_026110 [Puccinia striiformis f. sp. tritici]|nr:hypothetical protein Pst134EB_026110 [Puccinia striiformis f. sp. tritici]
MVGGQLPFAADESPRGQQALAVRVQAPIQNDLDSFCINLTAVLISLFHCTFPSPPVDIPLSSCQHQQRRTAQACALQLSSRYLVKLPVHEIPTIMNPYLSSSHSSSRRHILVLRSFSGQILMVNLVSA